MIWRPMSDAPRDGSSVMARRVPEDSERDFSGIRTWWGKTSHYGWCYLINDDDQEEVDLWHPDEWRYMVEELDV
jgi:hypothetical protein